jgi:hypothetical protein
MRRVVRIRDDHHLIRKALAPQPGVDSDRNRASRQLRWRPQRERGRHPFTGRQEREAPRRVAGPSVGRLQFQRGGLWRRRMVLDAHRERVCLRGSLERHYSQVLGEADGDRRYDLHLAPKLAADAIGIPERHWTSHLEAHAIDRDGDTPHEVPAGPPRSVGVWRPARSTGVAGTLGRAECVHSTG